ncbi:hypothetical protein GCM10010145_21410 [Streptomyces ruber]|uniref:Uncharacterized protein n=2 Tax=Streptomyces TaxID=1883 RepID=A0A918BAF0_9ACTN|nr:hypothetical protein [Streptomyces ruber]GGQ51784.1 hypothetical protein GCM10010145_21410 [Streptomyces ruber]
MFATRSRSRSEIPFEAADADVLRIICDSRTPVFVTVHAGGRRRYGYWQAFDARTNRGGCYVALPTEICDRLHSAGHIALGDALEDPGKTTYRVTPGDVPAPPARRRPAAPAVRMPVPPVPPVRPVRETLVA